MSFQSGNASAKTTIGFGVTLNVVAFASNGIGSRARIPGGRDGFEARNPASLEIGVAGRRTDQFRRPLGVVLPDDNRVFRLRAGGARGESQHVGLNVLGGGCHARQHTAVHRVDRQGVAEQAELRIPVAVEQPVVDELNAVEPILHVKVVELRRQPQRKKSRANSLRMSAGCR